MARFVVFQDDSSELRVVHNRDNKCYIEITEIAEPIIFQGIVLDKEDTAALISTLESIVENM